jgi:hypothetical protein
VKSKISVLTIILIVFTIISIILTITSYLNYQTESKYYQELLSKEPVTPDINYSVLTPDQKLALTTLDTSSHADDVGRENMYLSYMHSAYAKYSEMILALIVFIFLSIFSWKFDNLKNKN